MSLKRLHQVFLVKELPEATATTLFTAANGSYFGIDPQLELDLPRYERQINRSNLTRLQGLSGMRMGTMRFGLELTGTNAFSSVPQFGLPLQACGFRQETLIKMTIGAITGGPFRHGETVTQTGTSATGVVVADTYNGQTTIWIANQNGLGNGTAFSPTGVLTGGSSGATATPTGFATTLSVGAITGAFQVGEAVTQASSSAGGVISAIDLTSSPARIYLRQTTTANFNTTNVVTGGTSGATTTPSAVSTQPQAGYGWWPQSFELQALRFNASGVINTIANGDLLKNTATGAYYTAFGAVTTTGVSQQSIYVRRVSGHSTGTDTITNVTQGNTVGVLGTAPNESQFQIPCLSCGIAKDGVRESLKFARGTFSLAGTIGEPLIFQFELKGAFNSVADQGNPDGITFAQSVPPVMLDADLGVGHSGDAFASEYVPCIRSIEMAMNNEVNYLECSSDASGIVNTHLTDRKPTGSIDPDLLAEVVFPWLGDFAANVAFRARFTIGSALGNQFLFTMPALSTTGAPTGDRNGISTRQVAFEMTGGSQTVSALNVDNELVIIAPYA